MTDIGDCDNQAESVRMRLCVDGIVKVARVLAINGDKRQTAKVFA